MKHLFLSTALAGLAAAPLAAQDIIDLGEITVFANQTPTELKRTGTTVEIVEADDLQSSSTTRVADTIDLLPGVSTSSNGGAGALTFVRIRGLSARYIPVYIDGIDITDPASVQTAFDFGTLTSAGLSRVEILKGSQSALFGSEAIGGVINITTTRPTELGTTITTAAEFGSYDTYSAQFGVATKSERGEVALTLSHLRTDGFSSADENDGNTEADGHEATTLILSGAYDATDAIKLGFTIFAQNSETDQDGFPAPAFSLADTTATEEAERRALRLYAEIDGGGIQHTIAASYATTDRFYAQGFSQDFEGDRSELSYKGVAELSNMTLAFGANYSDESFLVDGSGGDYETVSVFGEVQYAASDALDLSFALRHDDHSEFGGFTTARLAAAYRISDATVVRAALANGFRAPSLYELFGPFGNAALEPETSRSFELGIEHSYGSGAYVKATAFYTEIDDLIDFDFATNAYAQVSGTSTTQGIELAGAVPLSDRFELFGSYTYTDAADRNGNQLVRVPEHDLTLGVSAQWTSQFSSSISLSHIAGRADDGFPSVPQADYTVVNADLSYEINDSATAYLRVNNLFDEEYQTTNGYGTSDRAVFFGVRAKF
jgi:vitamin B12 transporter